MNPIKLVILDRDGTINEDRDDFVKTPEEWVPFPGALEAIARLNHAGWHTVIATNQSGLGRGTFEMVTLNAMHTKMNQMLAKQGGRIDAVFFCPHAPDQACTCRKPLPGLFEQIGERFGVDLRDVPVVGDSVRDLQAGAAVGCRPHFVRTGKGGASRRRAARRAVRAGARHRGACRPRCIRRAPGPAAARRPRLSRWSRLRLREARLTHALNAVRSGLFVLFMVVTVIPWALAVLLVSVFARGNVVYWMCVGWLRTAIWGAKVLCGVHARLHGFERLPDSPVVLLPKHQSAWETFAFPTLMPHPLCYVFKRELLYIPFFGWAMARMDMIHIDRSKRSEAWSLVAAQGREFMNKGHWVIMFPEGTRAPRGGRGTYKSGGTRLAIDTGRPVVPIAVTSARCWPRKSFVLRRGVIDVSIGHPIPSVGRAPDELMREVETWIEVEMKRLDPEAYA